MARTRKYSANSRGRCETVRKTIKARSARSGKTTTFAASVGEKCVPAYKRPTAKQKAWRATFKKVSKSCPKKFGPARTKCMRQGLNAA